MFIFADPALRLSRACGTEFAAASFGSGPGEIYRRAEFTFSFTLQQGNFPLIGLFAERNVRCFWYFLCDGPRAGLFGFERLAGKKGNCCCLLTRFFYAGTYSRLFETKTRAKAE